MKRLLMLMAFASLVLAVFLITNRTTATSSIPEASHIKWDIISLSLPGVTTHPGGEASAKDNIGDTITLTGSGTFVAPSGGGGTSGAVTGGGDWTITPVSGSPSSGTYVVTGLVRWDEAPGIFPGTADEVGNVADFRPGLAVLRIEYNDGSHGILVVSCHGAGTPDSVFEGITASKDYVDFWNRQAPSGTPSGPNANRTGFHLVK